MRSEDPKAASAVFDHARLTLARQLAGKRKIELAHDIEVTPGAISQYERGLTKPSPAVLARLSLILGVPPSFFMDDGRPLSGAERSRAFFRSLRSTRQIERESAESYAVLSWEVSALLEKRVRFPEVTIPAHPLANSADEEEIEELAGETRRALGIPDGPVGHAVRLLEAHGAVVTRRTSATDRVDAFSQWIGRRPVVVLGDDKADVARSRFDGVHELAHLILHPDPEPANPTLERQANAFAAAFLMPRDLVRGDLPGRVDWQRLQVLKATWGVSMQALLFRARTLGTLSDGSYRRAMALMSKWGWRKAEPGALRQIETPTMLRSALALAEERGYSEEALASEARLSLTRIREILCLDTRPEVNLD